MIEPPSELAKFVAAGSAEHSCVAPSEFLGIPGEFGDLSRADEGEILWIEEDQAPLAGKAPLGQNLKSAFLVFLARIETRLDADDLECR